MLIKARILAGTLKNIMGTYDTEETDGQDLL